MKKLVMLVAVAAMVSFASCGGETKTEECNTEATPATEEVAPVVEEVVVEEVVTEEVPAEGVVTDGK